MEIPTVSSLFRVVRSLSGWRSTNPREPLQCGRPRVLKMFADWTDRIRAGEVPPAPARPQGLERDVVMTQWDWADPKA